MKYFYFYSLLYICIIGHFHRSVILELYSIFISSADCSLSKWTSMSTEHSIHSGCLENSKLSVNIYWTPIIQMLVHLMSSQRSLRLSHLVSFFFFILLCFSYFHHSVFQLTMCSSASVFCYWFFLVYASFQLLFCSSLIACSLVLEELECFC